MKKLYALIKNNPGLRLPHIAKTLKRPSKTIERWLGKLKAKNKIEFRGNPQTGGYYVKQVK